MINIKINKILFVVCAHRINPKCCKILTFKEHSIWKIFNPLFVIEKICRLLIIKRKEILVIKEINDKIKKNLKRIRVEYINAHGIDKKSRA